MYTKETLREVNERYESNHFLTEKDVNMANIYKLAIESSRSCHAPKPGDVLIMKDGTKRHIDEVENEYLKQGKITIVDGAYVPFTSLIIHDSNIKVKLNTSGGPWSSIDSDKIEHTGKQQSKLFGFFGNCGMRAGGQLQIHAMVNIFNQL